MTISLIFITIFVHHLFGHLRFFKIFKMVSNLQQPVGIKYCVKCGINVAEMTKLLGKDFGNDILAKANIYKWYDHFKSGRESVADDEHPERPSTSITEENFDKMKQLRAVNWNIRESSHLNPFKAFWPINWVLVVSLEGWCHRENSIQRMTNNSGQDQRNHVVFNQKRRWSLRFSLQCCYATCIFIRRPNSVKQFSQCRHYPWIVD